MEERIKHIEEHLEKLSEAVYKLSLTLHANHSLRLVIEEIRNFKPLVKEVIKKVKEHVKKDKTEEQEGTETQE